MPVDRGSMRAESPDDRFGESCMFRTAKGTVQGVISGFFMGAFSLAWYPDPFVYDYKGVVKPVNHGLAYVLRGLKAPTMWGAVVCATFSSVDCIMEQLRDERKESTYVNSGVAGAAAGIVMASSTRRFDIMASTALGMGVLMGMVEYNGQTITSDEVGSKIVTEGIRPYFEEDSDQLKNLKEKYPEFKDY